MAIRAVIFDRDGVINSEDSHRQSIILALEEMGVEADLGEINSFLGRHPDEYVSDISRIYKVSREDFLKKQKKFYSKLIKEERLSMRVISIIKELKKEGYLIGLVTSSDRESTLNILDKAGLGGGFFDAIVTSDEVKQKKPSPEPYLAAANKLKVRLSECFVIEDSPSGAMAAQLAGMGCMVLPNEHTFEKKFPDSVYFLEAINRF